MHHLYLAYEFGKNIKTKLNKTYFYSVVFSYTKASVVDYIANKNLDTPAIRIIPQLQTLCYILSDNIGIVNVFAVMLF